MNSANLQPAENRPAKPPPVRLRAAIEYAILGDLRYLSHHDEMRMLTRALVRSAWPLEYSKGFNPQPRFSIPLPRRTGIAADPQRALVFLDEDWPIERLCERLAAALPKNVPLRAVECPAAGGSPKPLRAVFDAPLDDVDLSAVQTRLASLLQANELTVARPAGPDKPAQTVDIRPFVESMKVLSDCLRMTFSFQLQRSARPADVYTILGLDAQRYESRTTRVAVEWNNISAAEKPSAAENERESLVEEENDA